jgi:hypothetical protein
VVRASTSGRMTTCITRDIAAKLLGLGVRDEYPPVAFSRRVGAVLSRLAAKGDVIRIRPADSRDMIEWSIPTR